MTSKGPLTGVKALDLSSLILGPYISQIMAEWGADVIKVESPVGDITRNIATTKTPGMSAIFMNLNHNKRSIVLDLKTPEGQDVLKRLVKESDVIVHNYRPRPANKLGVSYEQLSSISPKLVSCIAVGYGRDGRYSERPAYDDLIQGICGIADLNGRYNESRPGYVPTALADKVGSLMSLSAILAALYDAEKTGIGQEVEIPMFETLASFLLLEHLTGPAYEPPLGPPGHLRQMTPLRRPFKTSDSYICALPYTDKHWHSFFNIIGEEELIDDVRFSSVAKRTDNTIELYQMIERLLQQNTTEYWLAELELADIPFAPVSTLDDLLKDPHLHDVGLFEEYEHPSEGRLRRVKSPVTFSKPMDNEPIGASSLGENSREILKEAGYNNDQIDKLFKAKVSA